MPMRIGTEMPKLEGATEWAVGSQEEAEKLKNGGPTLIHFWSVSCGLCKENMPRVNELRETKREQGLSVIAVHLPRYETDTNTDAVKEAIAKHNITEPCAIDNLHKLKDTFQNEHGYVPAYYLFDAEGKLKAFGAGEKGLNFVMPALERILAQLSKEVPA